MPETQYLAAEKISWCLNGSLAANASLRPVRIVWSSAPSHRRLEILRFNYDTSMSEKRPRLSRSRDDTHANQHSRPRPERS